MGKYTKLTAAFKAITIDATLLNSKLLNAEKLNAKNILVETGYNQLSDIVSYIKEKDNEVSSKFVESTYTVERMDGNSGNVVLFIVPCDAYPLNVPFSRMSVPVTSGVPQMEAGGETTPVYLGVILWNADGTKEIYGISDNQVTCNKFSTATWNFDTKPIVFTNDYRLIFYFIANREDFTTTEPTVYKDKIKITTRLHPTLDNIDPYITDENWNRALTDLRIGWICNDSLLKNSSYPNWPACTFTTSKLTLIILAFPNILSLNQGLDAVTNNLNTHIGDSTHLTTALKNTISDCTNSTYTTVSDEAATAEGDFNAVHFKYQDVPHDFPIKKFILKPLNSGSTPLYMAVWTLTQSGQKTYVGLSDEAITWEANKDAVWTFNNIELIVPENHNVEFFLCTGPDAVSETTAAVPGVHIRTKYDPNGRGLVRYGNVFNYPRCIQATLSNNGYRSHVGDDSHLTTEQKNAIKDYLSHVGDDTHLTEEQITLLSEFKENKDNYLKVENPDIDYVIETGVSNNNWYRIYRSGWVEQGGVTAAGSSGTTERTVTLPVELKTANYFVQLTQTGYYDSTYALQVKDLTVTNFKVYTHTGGVQLTAAMWEAKGLRNITNDIIKANGYIPDASTWRANAYVPNNLTITRVENEVGYNGNTKSITMQTSLIENGSNLMLQNGRLTTWNSDLSLLSNGTSMFQQCSSLRSISCGNFNSLTNGTQMFGYSGLTSFNYDMENLVTGDNMFYHCNNLTSFSGDLSKLQRGFHMFDACPSLTDVSFGENGLSALVNATDMFKSCSLNYQSLNNILNALPSRSGTIHITVADSVRDDLVNDENFEDVEIPAYDSGNYYEFTHSSGWTIRLTSLSGFSTSGNPYDVSEANGYIPDASTWNELVYVPNNLTIVSVADGVAYDDLVY